MSKTIFGYSFVALGVLNGAIGIASAPSPISIVPVLLGLYLIIRGAFLIVPDYPFRGTKTASSSEEYGSKIRLPEDVHRGCVLLALLASLAGCRSGVREPSDLVINVPDPLEYRHQGRAYQLSPAELRIHVADHRVILFAWQGLFDDPVVTWGRYLVHKDSLKALQDEANRFFASAPERPLREADLLKAFRKLDHNGDYFISPQDQPASAFFSGSRPPRLGWNPPFQKFNRP